MNFLLKNKKMARKIVWKSHRISIFTKLFHANKNIRSIPAAPIKSNTDTPNKMQYSVCLRLRSRFSARFPPSSCQCSM